MVSRVLSIEIQEMGDDEEEEEEEQKGGFLCHVWI